MNANRFFDYVSWCRFMAVSLVSLLITACGFIPETRSWTESVQLDDGSMIKIKRYVKFERSSFWGAPCYRNRLRDPFSLKSRNVPQANSGLQ